MLLTFGDSQGSDGTMPVWLSQWLANFALLGTGLLLFARMSRGRAGNTR
jgi:hypothetical protein